MVESGTLAVPRKERYADWSKELGSAILGGSLTLADLERRVAAGEIDPQPRSGHQELLEGAVNRRIWSVDRSREREAEKAGGSDGQPSRAPRAPTTKS